MHVSKAQAALLVDRHVVPKACFITTDNGLDWRPLQGTGCAHWVAHQLQILGGTRGSSACDLGYPIRVRDVVRGRASVPPSEARLNDIWAATDLSHCGLVSSVTPSATPGGAPTIQITHDSSRQGGVRSNDWATYFHGGGSFCR